MNEKGNIKILIVDDMNFNRKYLRMVLSVIGGITIVGEDCGSNSASVAFLTRFMANSFVAILSGAGIRLWVFNAWQSIC
jgi:hypothetical protein